MKAEIVSVGTELLLGEIVDSNAAYLARHLPTLGIDLHWVSVVGDNRGRVVEILERAWGRSDLVIITGGLGPTEDDLTRESIADLMGEQMFLSPELAQSLRGFFEGRGLPMPERNIKQATLIPSSQSLPNPVGTAPGWWVERDDKVVVAMPGVPFEMYRMWEREVMPRLQLRQGNTILLTRTLKVMGMGESAVEEAIRELVSSANPTVATYAKQDGTHVRIGAKAANREEAQGILGSAEVSIRSILGTYIYGADNETLEGVVGRLILEENLTLALAEVSTGGWIANLLTGVEGKDVFFKASLVVPSLQMLPFPVTESNRFANASDDGEPGEAIAERVRAHFGADIGLVSLPAATGDGGTGTHLVCLSQNGVGRSQPVILRRAATTEHKRLICLSALNLLRRHLLKIG
ncbi:MAG: CinA family nicotinamide mononucleotide deamidase-related protein [Dehalococcoidia bacterium]|nr:CinA family nicotinamide mononucleotide deamidase-related protein [Dehalococcoidia bacterium]